jgi:hypothetical protein
VLTPGAAACTGRAIVEAVMRSCQGRGGRGSPHNGPMPYPDGVLIGHDVGVVDDGRSATRAWSGTCAERVREVALREATTTRHQH